ncbi:hypothetical protein HUW51_16390 [Adhaeribacter swui]|uniref:Uncharacterized protein n=1 Tax=Adhaeribacter swui TaxID=2086471 RepID=A0A7G7GAN8_9BACT|nr:hypothetical protein [Adhaeribacter swui]QNF34222.1 hypothetical protein HUW51_16390 [Adhaeribacter swui]
MQRLRFHILFRCFWLVLACHILNLSIDAPDNRPVSAAEDLTFNDVESVTELILENCLGMHNAVAEHDEPDDQGGTGSNFKKIDFFYQLSTYLPPNAAYQLITRVCTIQTASFYLSKYLRVISPPPEF